MDQPQGRRTCLYATADLDAILADMARQTVGLLTGREHIAIVGLLRRGAPLAEMLRDRLVRDCGFADDLTLLHPETELTESPEQAELDLSGTTVEVVDDVLNRGHSLLKSVECLAGKNRRISAAWCWWTAASPCRRSTPMSPVCAWTLRRRISSSATSRPTKQNSELTCFDQEKPEKYVESI